ncbi:bifunctional phosphoglucose/phosphomannose isomerase [candidate division KSB1 bacterium]|nr:bifunctional phosphoglucose/phosphomannose isomerase [candidate division KSB1 bacterium]RQW10501.1 MAG: bifunctional phosphoglucose/phosphomannose isomerase [candidate division KSB1 bacterium]
MLYADIKKYDRDNMFDLILDFPKQIESAWQRARGTSFPLMSSVDKIVVAGMGGSAIGGELLAGLCLEQMDIPLLVHRDYTAPRFINSRTLVLASSYSGNTEETLSALRSAIGRTKNIIGISSNGELEKLAAEFDFFFLPVPGGQPPRTALGYMFFSMLAILQYYGLLPEQDDSVDEVITLTRALGQHYMDYGNPDNPALSLAHQLYGRIPIIYGAAEPDSALPTRWRNQLSENAKVLAFANVLPEMNHNDIVGWHPASTFLDRVFVIFLLDDAISDRVRTRIEISREIITARGAPSCIISSSGLSKIARLFSLLVLIDYASFYLAILNRVDPTDISNIDYMKRELAARLA